MRGRVPLGASAVATVASALLVALPSRALDAPAEAAENDVRNKAAGAGRVDESPRKPVHDRGPREAYAHLWVGASLALDFLSMPSSNDVCALSSRGQPLNSPGLYCTNPDGTDFPSRSGVQQSSLLVPGHEGQSAGGLQGGDVRVLLNVDYALLPNLLVGGRVGYVANAYTGSAAVKDGRAAGFKFHVEGRATYLFGDNPLATVGFLPMGFAGLGLAEFDGHSLTFVTQSNFAGQNPVNVWRTDGPFFLMVGGGTRYQLSQRIAFTAAVRVSLAVGNGALVTFGPEVGVEYGF
jgi:hypothetical protein